MSYDIEVRMRALKIVTEWDRLLINPNDPTYVMIVKGSNQLSDQQIDELKNDINSKYRPNAEVDTIRRL